MIGLSSHSPWETQLEFELRISDCKNTSVFFLPDHCQFQSMFTELCGSLSFLKLVMARQYFERLWVRFLLFLFLDYTCHTSQGWVSCKLHLCHTKFFQLTHPDKEWKDSDASAWSSEPHLLLQHKQHSSNPPLCGVFLSIFNQNYFL